MEFDAVFADVLGNEEEQLDDGQTTEESGETEASGTEETGAEADDLEAGQVDDNAQFATARRRAEEEYRRQLELEQQKHARELDAFVQKAYAGQINPYTNQPFRSKADFDAYEQQYQQEQLKQAGVTPDMLNQIIMQNPIVQQTARMQQQIQMQEGQRLFEAGLAEISKIDPKIKTIDDLVQMPNHAEFHQLYMQSGNMVAAFKAATYNQMMQKQAEAGAQMQRNGTLTKNHLTPLKGSVGDNANVPTDVLESYRTMFPDWSDDDIAKDYKKRI